VAWQIYLGNWEAVKGEVIWGMFGILVVSARRPSAGCNRNPGMGRSNAAENGRCTAEATNSRYEVSPVAVVVGRGRSPKEVGPIFPADSVDGFAPRGDRLIIQFTTRSSTL